MIEEHELELVSNEFFSKFNDDYDKLIEYLIKESKNLQYIEELTDLNFFRVEYNTEIHCFEVLNETGIDELNMFANLMNRANILLFDNSDIGEIICFEIDRLDLDIVNITDFKAISKYIVNLYNSLGYQTIIIKKNNCITQKIREINKAKEYLNKKEKEE